MTTYDKFHKIRGKGNSYRKSKRTKFYLKLDSEELKNLLQNGYRIKSKTIFVRP